MQSPKQQTGTRPCRGLQTMLTDLVFFFKDSRKPSEDFNQQWLQRLRQMETASPLRKARRQKGQVQMQHYWLGKRDRILIKTGDVIYAVLTSKT